MEQKFGGQWTVIKLEAFERYLAEWMRILSKHPYFRRAYVDGFAGSGYVRIRTAKEHAQQVGLLDEGPPDGLMFTDAEHLDDPSLVPGSAKIAMSAQPGFHEYLLVDQSKRNVEALELLRLQHPRPASIRVVGGDANANIKAWIGSKDWDKTRALALLDPFALEVRWDTIQSFAATHGTDLWILFPVMGIQRLLQRDRLPPEGHARILDDLLGDPSWRSRFYRESGQQAMDFGGSETSGPIMKKSVDTLGLCTFFLDRLATVFPGVVKTPLMLRTSTGSPLFALFFVAANEKGADPAVRIASHIVKSMAGKSNAR